MADNWRMLDFTYLDGTIRFESKTRRLEVLDSKTGEMTLHSLNDVNIIFVGINVQLDKAAMYHLAKHDVVVLFCDWRGLPICSMYPWIDAHGRVAARQRAQASLSEPRSKNAWMRIVKAKIIGQANNLNMINSEDAGKLYELSKKVRSGDPSNVEGSAARIYWQAIFNDRYFRRTPGIGEDARNSLLDYGYTLLRGHSMRAVLSAGLTPALGMYHRNRSNLFALADDLIEPFRPVIDYAIKDIEEIDGSDFKPMRKHLMEVTLEPFDASGLSSAAVLTDFAQQYGRYVEGELDFLSVPSWKPLKEK